MIVDPDQILNKAIGLNGTDVDVRAWEDQIMMNGWSDNAYGWSGTMGFGLLHWIFFIAVIVAVIYPIGRILSRLGFSSLWSLVVFVPLVNLLALWILAAIDWPENKGPS